MITVVFVLLLSVPLRTIPRAVALLMAVMSSVAFVVATTEDVGVTLREAGVVGGVTAGLPGLGGGGCCC